MSRFQEFKDSVKLRLRTAARKHLVEHLDTKTSGYEKELDRQQRLPDQVSDPDLKLRRAVCPADVQQLSLRKEEVPPEQQNWSPSLDQDPEPPHIKEEQEELWISQEGELLRGLEEADITKFPFTPVPVKSEEDEEKPQSSQLHQRLTEQMETGADGEDCGGPGPARNSDPDTHLQPETDVKTSESSETEDSDDGWEETRDPQSGLNSLKNDLVSQSETTCDTGRKRFSCSECGETFHNNHLLKNHIRNHTGEYREAKQEDPEPPHIKEEQEELWTSQEGEQLRGLEEADITKFPFAPVPVKSEEDEEKPQSSQLHQSQTEQMETGADGEDCGGPGPARNSDPDTHLQPETDDNPGISFKTDDSVDSDFWKDNRKSQLDLNSLKKNEISESVMGCDSGKKAFSCSDDKASETLEPESDDSVDSDFWKDNRKPQLDLNVLKNNDVSESEMRSNTLGKPYSCSECGKGFLSICNMKNHMKFHTGERAFFCSVCGQKCLYKSHLKIHMRTHTGEKPFICPVCGKKYAHKASMQSHMVVHTVDKQYTCNVCDKSFAWYTELKYHHCVGESSRQTPHWGETM